MEGKRRTFSGILFLMTGILFLFIGIYRNEHVTVQNKSNMVCLECIGIG